MDSSNNEKIIVKTHIQTLIKLTGLLLLSAFLLFSCSKKNDAPPLQQLVLEVSATDIDEGDEVIFTVTADGKDIDADIYVDDTKISGVKHTFDKTGVYSVSARKAGCTDSPKEDIEVYRMDVYVAGVIDNSTTSYVANYRKSGNAADLSEEGQDTEATSIFVARFLGD